MKTILWVFIILTIITVGFNIIFPCSFYHFTESIIIPYTYYVVIFGLITFLLFEYPKYLKERKLADEQRRLYFYDLLTKDGTANRVREESFLKLLCEYNIQDFSGIQITNSKEGLYSPFCFYRCFKDFSKPTIKINNDIILETSNSDKEKIKKNIYLSKINFSNSDLSYANFDPISELREDKDEEGIIVDEHLFKYRYNFIFKYLRDTNLSHANLRRVKINNGSLRNVLFCNASFYNTDLRNTSLIKCDLSGTDLTRAYLENTSFFQTKIDDKTNFAAVRDYQKINSATPFIIERIKTTNYFDKTISEWEYDWESKKDSIDETFEMKWKLWNNLKKEFPDTYILKYKERIRDFYTQGAGSSYDWQREL